MSNPKNPGILALPQVFGEPDVLTGSGNPWYIIRNEEHAKLASFLSETAIDVFWRSTRKDAPLGDSHEWLIMVANGRAEVAMAAMITGRESMHQLVADCHITGFRNAPALPTYEEDIRLLCATLDLTYIPNHMGRPLEPESEALSP